MATPVEEIKERLNIVEVVSEYLALKRAGTNYKANCPFHNEKTPSFMVSEPKQIFHCFGCDKGGDVFTFIQEIEGVEFAEALRMLAKKANVELQPLNLSGQKERNERTELLDCLQLAADFFQKTLQVSPRAAKARAYLQERGVSGETPELFHLGYSVEEWDALLKFLTKHGLPENIIERAGLILRSAKTRGWYDRFRGRLIFPIHNHYGNVIGFGGRTLDPQQKEAKYINSPQTAVYNKSAVLYGLHLAKKYIQKIDAAVIVEGYMDVIAAHQAKFRNVVAASGTALTVEQIQLLKRYSKNVIFSFDADAAGLSAVWRGIQMAIQEGMNIKVLALPRGQDPDDVIRSNPAEFKNRAAQAKPFMEYAFNTVISPLDLADVHHKKKAAAELLPMIALFPDRIEQTHYLQLLASQLSVDVLILQEKIIELRLKKNKAYSSASLPRANQNQKQQPSSQNPQKKSRAERISELLLALILLEPKNFSLVAAKVETQMICGAKLAALYKNFLTYYNQNGQLDPTKVIILDPPLSAQLQELELLGQNTFAENDTQKKQQELLNLTRNVELLWVKQSLQKNQRQIVVAESAQDEPELLRLTQEHQQLSERRLHLE